MTKHKTIRVIALALFTTVLGTFGLAQDKVLTPELVLTVKNVVDVQLSPDGSNILYQLARARRSDEEIGPPMNELWMTSSRGGDPYRFTYNAKGDRLASWSPDGKYVAFLSQRGGSAHYQIYLIPSSGGEAMPLTDAPNSIVAWRWSPDGSKIAYTVTDPKTKEETQGEKEGRDWVVADRNYKHIRLHVIDIKSKQSKLVTNDPLTVHDFDWSPDGKKFVLMAADTPLIDDSYMRLKLFTVSSEGGQPQLLVKTEGKLSHPRWSPDGKWIAWLGAIALNDSYAGSIFLLPSGGGTPENLSQGVEESTNWLGWQPGRPSTIVITTIERQATSMYAIPVPGKKRTAISTQPIIYFSGPSFSKDGKLLAVAAHTSKHPTEVFFGESGASKAFLRLTKTNPQLADLALGEQEVVKWKSVDGKEIEGVIVKPIGFRPGGRYPTVMQPHGGPEGAELNGWFGSYSRWGQMLAAKGYVTFYPNYRGSIGRGPEFAMADHRDLMGKEFQDMLTGIDHLAKEGISDPNRVGVGGGSYGGYTSAWAATHGSDRFKAAIAWMGISNWYSMTGTSDIFWENSTVHWNAIMYDNFELYWERSPIAHIKKARTPTLIVHGAADQRVPPGQSLELYTALKWRGVPVEFVTYPREGHGVGERAHQLDFMNRVAGWFEKYVKNANGQ